ncbi:MAG: hypothetical protein QNL12_12845 [Acidimicrobiia bacterium]|nr:hypothetical protein [Acidimicrobiia bacterium]MDX2468198.1 hypothetical protein [Acidimicrobiia bacterium]
MQSLRNVIADVLVGVVLVAVAFWLLRGVFRMVYWGVSTVLVVVVVVFVFRIAAKLRG